MYPSTYSTFFYKLFHHYALVATLLMFVAGSAMAQVNISEIRIDQPSTDNDEYFELAGSPAESLDTLTYLVIGDGAGGSGVIESVTDLSGQAIPGSGYFVAAESSFTIGTADLTTSLNFENSDNVTHMLVANFTGANGDDLDTNDDGEMDVIPWGDMVDCIALIESVGTGELVYCPDTVGPDGFFVPAHSYDCPDGWMIGTFDPSGGPDTPGAANECGPEIPDVAISEIRIDQPSADNDEYFELAGDSDDSLDGLTYLVIGDGTGGSGVIEAVVDLSGQSIQPSGFFVGAEGTFSLGTADLTASLNFENGDNVTHMLVWNFTGASGDDLDTDDDGVPDVIPWDEVVDCIALVETVGSGDLLYCGDSVGPNGSFVPAHSFDCLGGWTIGAFDPVGGNDTPGAANNCPVPAGGLVINEIDYDQASTDTAEFIEIANTSASPVSLAGHSLVLVNGSNDSVYNTIPLPAITLPAGGFFVVCGDAAEVYNCDLDVSPDTNLVQNGAPDAVALFQGDTLLDTVSYEGDTGVPYTEGSGIGLEDSTEDFVGISRSPDSADTDVNNVDFSPRCVTPGMENTLEDAGCMDPAPPPLVINEIDYDQDGADTAEFIEIHNAGGGTADLGGVELVLVNGSGGGAAVYGTIALPDVSLAGWRYFVVCADAATVVNCDLEAISSIQNGSPDAVALRRGDEILDTVSYEGDAGAPYREGSGVGLEDISANDYFGISRVPNGADTDQNNVDLVGACITPGLANTSLTTGCSPTAPTLEIFEIQGNGATSVYNIQGVTTLDNIVTAVGPDGFFIQTPPERSDGNVDTSDGIRVRTGVTPSVTVGDRVDVTGMVYEYYELTTISGSPIVTVNSSGNPLPPAVVLGASVPSPNPASPSCAIEYECYEGMLVEIPNGVVTGGNQSFGSDPVAEVYISANGSRSYREPGLEYPGVGGSIPTWDTNPEIFELDPDKLGLTNQAIYAGSTFSATGVIGYEYGGYELWPVTLNVAEAALPVPVRSKMASETTIGSLNLFRLCDVRDDCPLRLVKFSNYIRDVLGSPDILAVQEAYDIATLQALADQIALDDPAVQYSPYLIEGNDIGGIDVGFLVRGDVVQVDAVMQLGAGEIFAYDGSLLHDRPPLLLEGKYTGNGFAFPLAVMVVHNRSLNGIETERVQLKRLAQAESVAAMVQSYQTANPFVPLSVVGDFNAFEFTDGYVDVVGHIKGMFNPAESLQSGLDLVDPNLTNQVDLLDAAQRYSFIYRGNAQALDHALTNGAATFWARGMAFGRGNADAALVQVSHPDTPLRSSDHDGLVLFMMTDRDGDGSADDVDACPDNQYATVAHAEYGCDVTIPTLNPFGMLLMLLLLGGLGAYTVRYRSGF